LEPVGAAVGWKLLWRLRWSERLPGHADAAGEAL